MNNKNKERETVKMKYIVIAVIAVVIVAAITVTVLVSKSKAKADENEPEIGLLVTEEEGDTSPVTMSDNVEVSFENMNEDLAEEFEAHDIETTLTTAYKEETTTVLSNLDTTSKTDSVSTTKAEQITTKQYLEETTVKTETPTQENNKVLRTIASFFKGKYYFDGSMVSGGEKTALEIAMDGNNFIVYSEMDGMDIGILNQHNKLYIINPAEKKYTEINSALKKMMDLDTDSLKFDFNEVKFDGYSPTSVTQATYNGQQAVCYTYKDSENHIEFIAVDDEIKQMTHYDTTGEARSVLQADEFTADCDDMVSLNGYKKTNLISFMSDFVS